MESCVCPCPHPASAPSSTRPPVTYSNKIRIDPISPFLKILQWLPIDTGLNSKLCVNHPFLPLQAHIPSLQLTNLYFSNTLPKTVPQDAMYFLMLTLLRISPTPNQAEVSFRVHPKCHLQEAFLVTSSTPQARGRHPFSLFSLHHVQTPITLRPHILSVYVAASLTSGKRLDGGLGLLTSVSPAPRIVPCT